MGCYNDVLSEDFYVKYKEYIRMFDEQMNSFEIFDETMLLILYS